jgi:hypothetical protein
MKQKYSGSEPIIKELVTVIFQIEAQLKIILEAFEENQKSGEKLRDKIRSLKDANKSVPINLNDNLNSITYLREWHWKYIERFENFVYESKSIYLDFDKLKDSSGFLSKGKRKKVLEDAGNFVLLGREYIETLGSVFDGDYLTLIPGEEIKNEALKLMSQRLGSQSK